MERHLFSLFALVATAADDAALEPLSSSLWHNPTTGDGTRQDWEYIYMGKRMLIMASSLGCH
jgi:hypothetical protein